jgi:hypothetical protein
LLTCRWANRATRRSIPFAAASRRCRAGSASFWMRGRHSEGAPPQSPMPLLGIVAFQGDSLALALVMVADRQHQWVDAMAVGAEQAHFPAHEALEQLPEGPFVAAAALPVNQPSCRAVVGLPDPDLVVFDPDLVVFALQEVPHLIEFDHHRIAGRRLAAVMIDIAAAQHRWRRGAKQMGHRVEGQALAVQADGGAFSRFRRAVPFKASEQVAARLVAAPLAAPPLQACDETKPDAAATAAAGTARKIGDHQDAKTVNSFRLYKIRHWSVEPSFIHADSLVAW